MEEWGFGTVATRERLEVLVMFWLRCARSGGGEERRVVNERVNWMLDLPVVVNPLSVVLGSGLVSGILSTGSAEAISRSRKTRGVDRACGEHEEGNGENHQESVIGGGADAPEGNVGGVGSAPPTAFGGAEFMQGMFIAIKQVVRNTVQAMQVPGRATDTRATTAMKAFLQLCPSTFRGELDPLVAEDWLEQVMRALDMILVTKEDFQVLFFSYQLQIRGSMMVVQYEAKFTSLSRFSKAFVSTKEKKAKQFMRGLRASIRNKIAGNLIKVNSIMVSSTTAIEETLNEIKKILNPKSQLDGTSTQSEGHYSKKPKTSTS
ncbi:hypothetical protein Acr_28g0004800 [Actinidia rufa]|uniref:Retrotransposon gag domain-containing protein n=1 Tax=Actinidia rufa TaxID=165716 RepID=A0A7J0H9Y0_9ERIC|nr:hypothetical protein Acr_00g0104480 [Actinidia rufa]GFZ19775.1 hypothetical protein Acr_28g0004800 [Actinidia rufa]